MAAGLTIRAAWPSVAVILSTATFAQMAAAHDHHEGVSHIAEGETVSQEPIVGGSSSGV